MSLHNIKQLVIIAKRKLAGKPFTTQTEIQALATTALLIKKRTKQGRKKWVYCFQCEIEMPVTKENKDLYCANCGLAHR